MRDRRRSCVPCILVIALTMTGCAPSARVANRTCTWQRPRIDPDLYCRIDAPARVTPGVPIPVRVTFTNVSGTTPLYLGRSVLPGDGRPGALRILSPDPRFALPAAARVDPASDPGDDARIDPGASISGTTDVTRLQPHLAEPGVYRIGLAGYVTDLTRGPRLSPEPPNISSHALVPCNQVVVTVARRDDRAP